MSPMIERQRLHVVREVSVVFRVPGVRRYLTERGAYNALARYELLRGCECYHGDASDGFATEICDLHADSEGNYDAGLTELHRRVAVLAEQYRAEDEELLQHPQCLCVNCCGEGRVVGIQGNGTPEHDCGDCDGTGAATGGGA